MSYFHELFLVLQLFLFVNSTSFNILQSPRHSLSLIRGHIIIIAIISVLFTRLQNLAYATAYAVFWGRFQVCSKISQILI